MEQKEYEINQRDADLKESQRLAAEREAARKKALKDQSDWNGKIGEATQKAQEEAAKKKEQLAQTHPGQAMIDAANEGLAGVPIRYGASSGFSAERIRKTEDDIKAHGATPENSHELESAFDSLNATIRTTLGPQNAQAKIVAGVVERIRKIEATLQTHHESIKSNFAGGS